MEDDQILNEFNHKGYDICIYQVKGFPSEICNIVIGDPYELKEVCTLRLINRNEAVVVAQAYIEGIMYGLKANKERSING